MLQESSLGKRYHSELFRRYLFPLIDERYEVIGVCDKAKPNNPENINFPFIPRSDELKKADNIIVTSDVFFEEIKAELVDEFSLSSIVSLESIENEVLNSKFHQELFDNLSGVEIGGPSDIFRFIYRRVKKCDGVNFNSETVWWNDEGDGYSYRGNALGRIIIADAVNLSEISDNTYDFCVSSNNLEHIANPLQAVKENIRVLKNHGILLIVVPKKEDCFDHYRKVTSFNHLLDDYRNGTDEHDMTHLDEIAQLHDFAMDDGIKSKQEFLKRAKENYYNRCLHHHVFDENLLIQVFEYCQIELIETGQVYSNYYALGRVGEHG